MRYQNLFVLGVAAVAISLGAAKTLFADSTQGGNNCHGTGRETKVGPDWVPAWVGCEGTCNVPLVSPTCTIQTVSGDTNGFHEKVCVCRSQGGIYTYDTLTIGDATVTACNPVEQWYGSTLTGVVCWSAACSTGTCVRDYTFVGLNEREFHCTCN